MKYLRIYYLNILFTREKEGIARFASDFITWDFICLVIKFSVWMIRIDFNKLIHKFILLIISDSHEADSIFVNLSLHIFREESLLHRKVCAIRVHLKLLNY